MRKRNMVIGITLAVLAVLCGLWWMTTPRYEIVQEKISFNFSDQARDDFYVMPKKVCITNIWKYRPVTIPIEIYTHDTKATFSNLGQPVRYDVGYFDATQFDDYKFDIRKGEAVGDKTIVYVTISKENFKVETDQQKCFSITERVENNSTTMVSRCYIASILINK